MIKAVFFDVDGTLISYNTKKMPESTKLALKLLKDKGIKREISTGRHRNDLIEMEGIDFIYDGYLTLNGQLILDENLKRIGGNPISSNEVEVLSGIFNAKKIPFKLITEDGYYINYVDDIVITTQSQTNGKIPLLGKYKGEDIYQINAYAEEHVKDVLSDFLDECDIVSWYTTGLDIFSKGGGKGGGVKSYLNSMGFKPEEAIAFGDSSNDISMLKAVGLGIAMGNANQEAKDAADYVCEDCDDDGIYKALKHFEVI